MRNKLIDAEVGDFVAGYCCTSKVTRVGRIQSIKKKFTIDVIKHTPEPLRCVWIAKGE